jgi:serine/threonine protein kinase
LKFLSENASQDSDALKRFRREARIASTLNHPNICTIYDIEDHDGRPFIVMELLEGQPLSRRISGRALPVSEHFNIARQIADALEALHSRGIVHRDIKPSNIFVSDEGHTKILDFGLAKAPQPTADGAKSDASTFECTAISRIAGTLNYMSPEQVLGRELDTRIDLFSFGVVLYEMATGRVPFHAPTWTATADAIINAEPAGILAANPDAPLRLAAIVEKAIQKDPDRRYQMAASMKSDLIDWSVSR